MGTTIDTLRSEVAAARADLAAVRSAARELTDSMARLQAVEAQIMDLLDRLGGSVPLRRLFNLEEAGAFLDLHPRTVARHARAGRIAFEMVGEKYRFKRVWLERYRESRTVGTLVQAPRA